MEEELREVSEEFLSAVDDLCQHCVITQDVKLLGRVVRAVNKALRKERKIGR